MKNHAFLMAVHKQPKLLRRIIERLSASNHYFFINVNARLSNFDEFVNELNGISNVVFLTPRVSIYHSGISQVVCTLNLLKCAKSYGCHFDYYHLISGQDYPLRSNEQFDHFFDTTEDSFMCYSYETDSPIKYNYTQGWFFNKNDNFFAKVYLKLKLDKLAGLIVRRKRIDNLMGGWDWFSWSDKVCDYVLDYIQNNPDYFKRFNHTHSPCETMYQTLLYPKLDELKIHKHYPLRFISWEAHRPVNTTYRPYNLNELDYKYVIESPTFFCRKVDEKESAKLLDMIDKQRDTSQFDISKYKNFM